MIPLFKVFMSKEAPAEVRKVLESGYIGEGNVVKSFERALKMHFNNPNVLTVNSGTSGLHLAIHMLKTANKWVDFKTEVLATPLTCTATNFPILANSLKIKWVDIDIGTMNMDMEDMRKKLTPNTRLVLPVHWGGRPIDYTGLEYAKDEFESFGIGKLRVIEDCAHSIGSKIQGLSIGDERFGRDIQVYSLQAIKHLTSVDGGIIITSEFYDRAKKLRWYGIDREAKSEDLRCDIDIQEWGFKYHMNDVSASVGLENIRMLSDILLVSKSNAEYYNIALSNVDGVMLLDPLPVGHESSWWLYTMHVKRRDDFIRAMHDRGIMVSKVHSRNDTHSVMARFREELPNLEKASETYISIPVGWWVNEYDRNYIVKSIKEGW